MNQEIKINDREKVKVMVVADREKLRSQLEMTLGLCMFSEAFAVNCCYQRSVFLTSKWSYHYSF